MKPGNYALALYRGDTAKFDLVLWEDTDKTVPFDLTDVTAKSEIRERPGGSRITEIECTIEAPNIIHVLLSAEQARTLPNRGAWDVQLSYPDGVVTTIIAGPVTVTPDVTDST